MTADQPDSRKPKRLRQRALFGIAWRLGRAAAIAYLVVLLLLMLFENRLIYFPSKYPQGHWTPTGLTIEDAWFQTPDGLSLHGWYVPHADPAAYVLFCHGNAGNVTHRTEILRQLNRRARAAVLIFDYRGYGRSAGKPNEQGILADARAARQWLAGRAGIKPESIVLLGESIGGAVAVDVAGECGAKGLVLENTFTSLPDLASRIFPWLPVRRLMRSQFDSLSKIGRYRGPLLQTHGNPDGIVPYEFGRRLFEAANPPKHFLTLEGYDHNDPRPSAYYDQIGQFLAGL